MIMNNGSNENILSDYTFVKEICHTYEKDTSSSACSFEGTEAHITIIEKDKKLFMRAEIFKTTSEGNGRPVTMCYDRLYPVHKVSDVNRKNWKEITYSKFEEMIELNCQGYEGVNERLLQNAKKRRKFFC